ncbi:MAG TPA: amidohydrolase family protein [Thermoanaerobaculia bacterium]|nr:amidohydrolase family protein [Thermoanaerobaculia bacterium]
MKFVSLLAGAVLAAASASGQTVALVGGTLHLVSGPDVASGTVVLRDGKIAAMGAGIEVPAGAKVVDVKGRHVYPSLFPALTELGLVEISSVRATVDTTELGEINPQARADFAMNFDSELLPVARSAGILIAGVAPVGGIVSGSLAAMKLDGWTREDATLKAPAAIVVRWPDLAIDRSPAARVSVPLQEKRRDEALEKLRNVFAEARAYAKAKAAEGKAGIPRHDDDPRLEALLPALDGSLPVIVLAQRVAQIRAALAWAREENVKLVLAGARDGWRVADEIAKANVPVIVEQPLELPTRQDEPYDANFTSAGALAKAGVRVAFSDGSTAYSARNLPHQAAAAVAFGFPREKAVEAMTLEPARILGVAARVGSLEPGKDATLIVTDGDILDLRTSVLAAYLDGRALDLTDKQKRLYERYKNRPKATSR